MRICLDAVEELDLVVSENLEKSNLENFPDFLDFSYYRKTYFSDATYRTITVSLENIVSIFFIFLKDRSGLSNA